MALYKCCIIIIIIMQLFSCSYVASVSCIMLTGMSEPAAVVPSETPAVSCSDCGTQHGYLLRPCMHTCCKACGKDVTKDDKCPKCQRVVRLKVVLYAS